MRLRVAERNDVDAIAELINAAFRVERFFIDRDRTSPEKVLRVLQTGQFLLVEDNGALVGCVQVEVRGERGYFGLLSVAPGRQRSGVGASLVAAAEDHCRAQGCRFMDLQIVNLRTELPGFYRRLGYVETGTAPFAADAEPRLPCHFVKMSKPLR